MADRLVVEATATGAGIRLNLAGVKRTLLVVAVLEAVVFVRLQPRRSTGWEKTSGDSNSSEDLGDGGGGGDCGDPTEGRDKASESGEDGDVGGGDRMCVGVVVSVLEGSIGQGDWV